MSLSNHHRSQPPPLTPPHNNNLSTTVPLDYRRVARIKNWPGQLIGWGVAGGLLVIFVAVGIMAGGGAQSLGLSSPKSAVHAWLKENLDDPDYEVIKWHDTVPLTKFYQQELMDCRSRLIDANRSCQQARANLKNLPDEQHFVDERLGGGPAYQMWVDYCVQQAKKDRLLAKESRERAIDDAKSAVDDAEERIADLTKTMENAQRTEATLSFVKLRARSGGFGMTRVTGFLFIVRDGKASPVKWAEVALVFAALLRRTRGCIPSLAISAIERQLREILAVREHEG